MAFAYGIALGPKGPTRLTVSAFFRQGDGMLYMNGKFTNEVKAVLYASIEAVKTLESYFDEMDSSLFGTHDLTISVSTPHDYVIGGESYGLPLAIAIAASIAHRPISKTTCFTGGIEPGGDIIEVDAIDVKRRAAAVYGFERIVLPSNQLDLTSSIINQVPVDTLVGAMSGVFWE